MIQNLNEELFSFIKKSPTGFHAVHELANYLTEAGFERLAEGNTWNLAEGGKYFVTRDHRIQGIPQGLFRLPYRGKPQRLPDLKDQRVF